MQTQEYFDRMEKTASSKLRVLGDYLFPGAKVLDFGSGPSDFVYNFVTACDGEYTALDNSTIVQVMLAEKNIPSISQAQLGAEEYDIIYMSSVYHEILSYLSRIEGRRTMAAVIRALKKDGVLIIRDWQTTENEDAVLSITRTPEINAWFFSLFENGVLNGGFHETRETLTLHGTNVYEFMLHVTWGLQSLERESQERYHFEENDWTYLNYHLHLEHVTEEQDETYGTYFARYFDKESIQTFFDTFVTKETRVYRKQRG